MSIISFKIYVDIFILNGCVVDVEIADEPISNKVKLNLEGPLLPTLKTDDANPSSYHLLVWLELITSDYNKSQVFRQYILYILFHKLFFTK